jgi:hypothetical protein
MNNVQKKTLAPCGATSPEQVPTATSAPVNAFNWRSFTAGRASPVIGPQKQAPRARSGQERAAQILAHRWGNPYSRPGRI